MSMVSESGSNVDRRIFSPAGGGLFPFLIVDQETPEGGGTGFGTLTLVVDENKRIEFPSSMLGQVHLMIEAGMRWLWQNYPGEDYAQTAQLPSQPAVIAQSPNFPEPDAPLKGVPIPVPPRIESPSYHNPPHPPVAVSPAPQQSRIERQQFDDESWWPYQQGSGPTEKQLKFITSLAKKAGMDLAQADVAASEGYAGRRVDELDTRMASGFIDWLKGQEAQARHGAPAGDPPPR